MSQIRRWFGSDLAPGVVLVAATLVALVLVNSPAGAGDESWWRTGFGPGELGLHLDLRHWVNDGLMTLFFFVIGLEIKHELVAGELAHPRRAVVPVLAAIGGAVVPGALFAAMTWGQPAVVGWGIPMATDPAFAVGLLALLAPRVPPGVRVLLLAFATVDDVLAVLVIAVGYTRALAWPWLLAAAGGCLVVGLLRRFGASSPWAYVPVGVLVWYATLRCGVHATLAGVALALLTPATPVGGRPVLAQLTRVVAPVSAFLAVPLFALANAGVDLTATPLGDALGSPVAWAVVAGLLAGKLIGVTGTITLATATGLGHLPEAVTTRHVIGLGFLGALGFTVALFITELAYVNEPRYAAEAKLGILAAAVIASAGAALALARPSRSA